MWPFLSVVTQGAHVVLMERVFDGSNIPWRKRWSVQIRNNAVAIHARDQRSIEWWQCRFKYEYHSKSVQLHVLSSTRRSESEWLWCNAVHVTCFLEQSQNSRQLRHPKSERHDYGPWEPAHALAPQNSATFTLQIVHWTSKFATSSRQSSCANSSSWFVFQVRRVALNLWTALELWKRPESAPTNPWRASRIRCSSPT